MKKAGRIIRKRRIVLAVCCAFVCLFAYGCGKTAETVKKDSDFGQTADFEQSENSKEDGNQSTEEQKGKEEQPKEDPVLEGEIKELNEKGFVAVKHKTWETEDGEISVGPGTDDDSDFEKLSVSYDDDTAFFVRTIYDGGERFEDEEAEAKDLVQGMSVNVWGKESDGEMKAETISIVKVVF